MLRAVTSRLSTNILHRINIDRHLRCGIEVSRCCYCYSTGLVPFQNEDSDSQKIVGDECNSRAFTSSEVRHGNQAKDQYSKNARDLRNFQIGENVSRKDKMNFLVKTEAKELVIWQLFDLKDSKEAVYSALDAWVAWEQNFPIVSLKRALITLEKEEQWHRIIQVLKWMLSKGQGTTRGTYGQLIRALDKDRRAEEAHNLWVKKISHDLHSVPWQLCHLMISIYYRNNMPERLVKGLEAFDRKPPDKSIVQKVADAYEMLGLLEEQKRVLEKYKDLFTKSDQGNSKKSRRASLKTEKKEKRKQGRPQTSQDKCLVQDDSAIGGNDMETSEEHC
ncbi:pentatricopeptide repeat-containing protein At4g18975, chloroplastic isoform X2 [Magnolia sinica]|uniref:pentatricopeptide repeat-containing protein At4g18975, chloroplastic isoform X2 n=1 Tax=Magnolia sinica TaxID=86752 RepID=UPI0026591D55|nr:pentatricopeptide repeat-containing protein At4g18975, chloroplastic isoform X2 [Magnolia sinica]